MRILVLIFTAIFITGCVTLPMKVSQESLEGNKGVILASVTKSGGSDVWFYYKKVGDSKVKRMDAVGLSMIGVPDDFPNDKNKQGRVLAFQVEPGEYELTKWTIYDFHLDYYKYISPKSIKPIRFTVRANRVTYLGNLHVDTIEGKNIFGAPIFIGGRATIRNNYSQDIAIFKKKYPKLSNLPIDTQVHPISGWGE